MTQFVENVMLGSLAVLIIVLTIGVIIGIVGLIKTIKEK
jgi:hypothetical protein